MPDKNYKILIVDDDDIIRETYAQIFKQKKAEVISAKDGVDGLDLATKEMPDVILTGIIMPRMDGFQLIKALKENIQTAVIPIAILSHLGREEDRKKAKELGIVDFIVQGSVTPNELVERIKNLTHTDGSFKLSFDPYAWDAPRLAETLDGKNLSCPNCQEKLIMEVTLKKEGRGFDGILKCPKCDYST
jgi:DNA-binding response OmpR family regulator